MASPKILPTENKNKKENYYKNKNINADHSNYYDNKDKFLIKIL